MTSVAFYLSSFGSGGVQRQSMSLAHYLLERGYDVTFVVHKASGPHLDHVPKAAVIHELGTNSTSRSIIPMIRYIRRANPDILVSNMPHPNLVAITAKLLTGFSIKVVAIEHNHFSRQLAHHRNKLSFRILPWVYPTALRFADAIVAVSAGVATDLANATKIDRTDIDVIHNPAVPANIAELANAGFLESLELAEPYIVAVGRLVAQKDFSTLLRAVARLKQVNLLVLGDGPLRDKLEREAGDLGISGRVTFAGFVSNPYPYLAKARVLALSSSYEGFGNVVAEALALNIPVVSTDCESGPAEILEGGRYGMLVPVGDHEALANALEVSLRKPIPEGLQRRGEDFKIDHIAPKYIDLFNRLAGAESMVREPWTKLS